MKTAAQLTIVIMAVPFSVAFAHQPTLGPFESHGDVGPVKRAGSVSYNPAAEQFTITGSGSNMWFDHDEFQFVWRRVTGDFILDAAVNLVGEGVEPHRKLGWMIRKSLEPSSSYVDIAVHGDGRTSLQFRKTAGGQTEELRGPILGADVVQLARKGNKYTMSVAWSGSPFASPRSVDVELGDDVYVGLYVCSHNADVVEKGECRNVRITVPAADDFVPYRDYIGGNLEVLDVGSGNRTVVHRSPGPMQAPNWTTDGKALIYNERGRLYRFDLASNKPTVIDTGFATANNNDRNCLPAWSKFWRQVG